MINSDTLENSYWKVSLDPKLLATSIISSIREYRQNPQIFRQAAFLESKKNSWKNIGEATINIYNKIFQALKGDFMDIYQHRRHNKNLLMVHLIFVTKYRKKIVLGDFRDAVK